MGFLQKNFLLFSFLALLFAPFICSADELYQGEKLFYLASYNIDNGLKSIKQNYKKIDILAPQMHSVDYSSNYKNTGNFKITGKFGPQLEKVIKDYKLKVMPLVTNAHFNQTLMHNLLLSKEQQDRVIVGLIWTAKQKGYIGWQYDFENISYQDKDLFSAFVQRSYKEFKKNKLKFSMAVVSRTKDFEDTDAFKNWGGVYDYKVIADNSDFVTLMAYDDPNSQGPVGSIDFVQQALYYVKDKIPASKLSLGVPLYGWKWQVGEDKKIGSALYKNVFEIMASNLYTAGFDSALGSAWIAYTFKEKPYKIWFNDKQSLSSKLDIAKENGFRGFSAWLIGGEDPAIWDLFPKRK